MWYELAYPRMTVLVTCSDGRKDNIITVAWHTPVNFNPPLYAVCIGKKRFSHGLIKKSREFVVNFVDREMEEKAVCCGTVSGEKVDKFEFCGLTREKSVKVKVPRIKEASAWLECILVLEVNVGDHTIFVGKVVEWEERKKGRLYQTREGFTSL